jgi:glucosamine--fructose-6-phosphate aminotransferase (isomerizing)
MCGIVGYIGERGAAKFLIEGLKRLEYRGYDSAGIAFMEPGKVRVVRSLGKVTLLESKLGDRVVSGMGIAHTRWATHGKPSEKNAHPHADCSGRVAVVHNGIIENYQELRTSLEKRGHRFRSETDTETIAHLIEEEMKTASFEEAFPRALRALRGAYGIVALSSDAPEFFLAARQSSPLVIGIGRGEMFIASDVSAMVGDVKRVVYLDDGEIAKVSRDGYSVKTRSSRKREKKEVELEWDRTVAERGGFPHFMLKEIFEQPKSFADALRGRLLVKEGRVRLGGLMAVEKRLHQINRIVIVSCGTSYHSGLVGEYLLEEIAGISTEVEMASEFRYRKPIVDRKTMVVAISQSGETADTLAAIREAKSQGALTIGIVNTVGSTISRETDAGVYCHAGPEISVASTKAYTSQLAILSLLAVYLGQNRGLPPKAAARIVKALAAIPKQMEAVLEEAKVIKSLAKRYAKAQHYLYLGRKYNFPNALEGALKIKEIAYVPAQGYPTGEMKHGPIALIEPKSIVIMLIPDDSVYAKNMSGMEEIRARGGSVLAIATAGDRMIRTKATHVIAIPKTLEMLVPILSALPLQLFAYFVAAERGYDIDQPRNLAKSVTVE